MSSWREQRNERSRLRLTKALPQVFPAVVLRHALARPLVPPQPRLAIESYWRAHPIRADRLARALAVRSGTPKNWAWTVKTPSRADPAPFRSPPAPYRDLAHARGPGHCCVCGQPVYRLGWHRDLWGDGRPNARAKWHACCVAAWKTWVAPATQIALLRKVQHRRCALTGARLLRDAEVDHRVPLFAVWRDHRGRPWPELLAFWGFSNLQAINRAAHRTKCAAEAGERASSRTKAGGSPPT